MRRLATAVLLALIGSGAALADEPVKIIVPFAAGGPVDTMARILAQEMQGPLGSTIVVENRAGGGGVIAADFVSRAAPDGKTLLMGSQGSHVITAVLQPHVASATHQTRNKMGALVVANLNAHFAGDPLISPVV